MNSTCLWNAQSTWVFRIKYTRTIYKSDSSCCSLFCCWLREHAAQNLWVMSACVRLTCVWIETYKGIKQRKIWEISVSERTLASSSDMWIIQFLVNTHTWRREAWAFLPSILLELGITYTGKLKNMIFSILCLYLRSLTLCFFIILSYFITSAELAVFSIVLAAKSPEKFSYTREIRVGWVKVIQHSCVFALDIIRHIPTRRRQFIHFISSCRWEEGGGIENDDNTQGWCC